MAAAATAVVAAATAAGSLSKKEVFETSGLTLDTSPLRALAGRGLSSWSDMMEILWKEKYRERMVSLRGLPSLTICSGKADTRGRLEAGGESSGVVTAVHVSHLEKPVCERARVFLVHGGGWLMGVAWYGSCLLYTSPSPRDATLSRMPSSA